jgi:excisionase family DNA binding protein
MKNLSQQLNLLTLDEAAATLKVSKRTLHRLIKDDKMPAFKVGNQWRIEESTFRKWIAGEESP